MNTEILSVDKLNIKSLDCFKTAVISFCDKGDIGVDFSSCPNLRHIKCSIDDLWVDEIDDEKPFKDAFSKIAKFVLECDKNNIKKIICQCKHGQSRSAACAAAINQYFNKNGIDIFADYKYCPNQYFYNGIFNALNNK